MVKSHIMSVMGVKGDTKIIWSSDNADEVSSAKRQFDELKRKGFVPFSVSKDGEKSRKITDFDPNAEKIILVPPMAGG